jgi:hypothetical protein
MQGDEKGGEPPEKFVGNHLPGEATGCQWIQNLRNPEQTVETPIGDAHLSPELLLEVPCGLFETDRIGVENSPIAFGDDLEGIDEIVDVRLRLQVNGRKPKENKLPITIMTRVSQRRLLRALTKIFQKFSHPINLQIRN